MRCSRCHTDNRAGMELCGQCGAPLYSVCQTCGASNRSANRFCGQCGRALGTANPASTLSGEMKQVSVLFCDIVNSTAMSERLGPEAMRDLVSSFLHACSAEVHRYGGTIPQFTGDGFMALFGAPVAYEDHVSRCLSAALAIKRTLGPSESGRLDLPIRFGIHTGPVVFGPIGEKLAGQLTAIGDTTNVAARLQQAAEPGMILLSETTRRLAQGFSQVEPVGPLTLKGKVEPIVAYRLLGVSHRRSGLRESGLDHVTTFVDRYSELAILNNALQQVEDGRSQTIGVVGEPGIGKSRLLAEFRQQLAPGRVNWVEGRCVSYGTAIPYWLLLDLLRSNCGIVETETQEAIGDKIYAHLRGLGMAVDQDGPVLLHLLGISDIDGSPTPSNPEAIKTKAFEVVRHLCVSASAERPLKLAIEDLHWIDKISEEFIGYLAERATDARILILATYRLEYRPTWIDKSSGGQAPLQPLSPDDSRQVVRSVLSAERFVDLVTEEIVAKADGNPFFLEQLALHAGEAKDLRFDLMVPDSIHEVMMARIDRLPDQTKQLLQIAAVIGRQFSFRLLSAVWNDTGPLEPQLRELIRLEFISERVVAEESTYVFGHALTQEAAYGSLLERHRRSHHATVGWALEELYGGRTEEVAELLAFHLVATLMVSLAWIFSASMDLDIDGPHRTLGLHHTYCTAGPFWPSATLVEGTRKNDWLQMPMEIDSVTVMAVVDTSASYTMIRSPTMRRLGLTENAIATDRTFRMSIVAGNDTQARVHKFQTIRLGPVTAHDASILVLPGEPPSLYGGRQMPDAIVGQDLLRNRRVWFSWSTGRLYLSFGGPRT